jgi:hypothetical protein
MSSSAYSTYSGLNFAEKRYLQRHPEDVFTLKRARDEAYAETFNLFGKNGHNDESDAFRHCYWAALLAKEIGFVRAIDFTTAHEFGDFNSYRERDMDLHNNAIGLRIGRTGVANLLLRAQCLKALKQGKLKILNPKKP